MNVRKPNDSSKTVLLYLIFIVTVIGFSRIEIASTFLVIGLSLIMLFKETKSMDQFHGTTSFILLASSVLLAMSMLSYSTTNGIKTSLVFIIALLAFISTSRLNWNKYSVDKHLKFINLLALLSIIIGYLFYFNPSILNQIGNVILNSEHLESTQFWNSNIRMTSTFVHPSIFGSFIYIAGLISLYMLFAQKRKLFPLISLMVIISAIFLTNTRTVILAFAIGALVFVFYHLSFKKLILIFAASGFVGLVYSLLSNNLSNYFILADRINTTDSIDSRQLLYNDALSMFYDKPLFGHGLGSFLHRPSEYVSTWEVTNAHNLFLQLLAEIGLIGTAIVFTAIIFLIVIDINLIKKLKKKSNTLFSVQVLAFSITIAVLADSMVQNPLYSWRIVVLVGFIRGISYFIYKQSKEPSKSESFLGNNINSGYV